MKRRVWISASLLLLTLLGAGAGLAAWKSDSLDEAAAAAAGQGEPMQAVTAATAELRQHRAATTSIGTVRAMRSITLRNEVPGTVERVALVPGRVVEPGSVLVRLDVSVEEAELQALEARAALAQTLLDRHERAGHAVSAVEVDRARAERDVARAEIARTRAIIERKTIRAPFRARVGLADVHPGQYLDAGTELTTLQGVAEAAHVDFTVAQAIAAGLEPGDRVDIFAGDGEPPIPGTIVAIDARVDPTTRNATARARVEDRDLAPGAAVRVEVPVGEPRADVVVPVSALRKGPAGDHVFVLEPDEGGAPRARLRPVESGTVLGDEVVIHAGLAAGERVAASGSFKLYESVRVAVTNPPAGAGAVAGAAK